MEPITNGGADEQGDAEAGLIDGNCCAACAAELLQYSLDNAPPLGIMPTPVSITAPRTIKKVRLPESSISMIDPLAIHQAALADLRAMSASSIPEATMSEIVPEPAPTEEVPSTSISKSSKKSKKKKSKKAALVSATPAVSVVEESFSDVLARTVNIAAQSTTPYSYLPLSCYPPHRCCPPDRCSHDTPLVGNGNWAELDSLLYQVCLEGYRYELIDSLVGPLVYIRDTAAKEYLLAGGKMADDMDVYLRTKEDTMWQPTGEPKIIRDFCQHTLAIALQKLMEVLVSLARVSYCSTSRSLTCRDVKRSELKWENYASVDSLRGLMSSSTPRPVWHTALKPTRSLPFNWGTWKGKGNPL